jgi:hypothetical protein
VLKKGGFKLMVYAVGNANLAVSMRGTKASLVNTRLSESATVNDAGNSSQILKSCLCQIQRPRVFQKC